MKGSLHTDELMSAVVQRDTGLRTARRVSHCAGLVGAVAIHFKLSATLSLVAMSPCMILVPGVYFLNSLIDMHSTRMELGGCRLLFATLIMVAISAGFRQRSRCRCPNWPMSVVVSRDHFSRRGPDGRMTCVPR